MEVYHELGPGLLEGIYERALMCELKARGLNCANQVPVEVKYKGIDLQSTLRLDILVEDCIILELKSVEVVLPVHKKQLITYLKLTGKRLGYVVNFCVEDICTSSAIIRIANKL